MDRSIIKVYDKVTGEELLIKAGRFNSAIHTNSKPAKKKKDVKAE